MTEEHKEKCTIRQTILKDSTIYTPSLQDVNLPLKATNFEDHTQTQLFNPDTWNPTSQ